MLRSKVDSVSFIEWTDQQEDEWRQRSRESSARRAYADGGAAHHRRIQFGRVIVNDCERYGYEAFANHHPACYGRRPSRRIC